MAGFEPAFVVEHAVVGQHALVRDLRDAALVQQRRGVEHQACTVGKADQRGKPAGFRREVIDGGLARSEKTRPQQQVFGRIATQREFRTRQQIRAARTRVAHQRAYAIGIGCNRTDRKVMLGKSEAQRGHGWSWIDKGRDESRPCHFTLAWKKLSASSLPPAWRPDPQATSRW